MPWYVAALLAALFFGVNMVLLKTLSSIFEAPNTVILFGLYLTGAVLFLVHVRADGHAMPVKPWLIVGIIGTGVLSYLGFFFQMTAVAAAPNPGYVSAIVGSMVVVSTIIWWVIQRNAIHPGTLVGIALCVGGIACIALTTQPKKTAEADVTTVSEAREARPDGPTSGG